MELWWFFFGSLALTYLIFIYNRLVALKQYRKNAFADIDVQLKLRHDLVPNLVETVKRYLDHEQQILENVSAARATAMQANNVREKIVTEVALSDALAKLYSVVENYPDIKADATFARLQSELSSIERSIAAARRFFNTATAEFNTARQQFPANIVAGLLGFKEQDYFGLDNDEREQVEAPPSVAF